MISTEDFTEATVGQVRHVAEAVADATLTSVKHNQELAGKAYETMSSAVLSGLGSTTVSEWTDAVRETVSAGFGIAKDVIDGQLEFAEKVLRAATSSPSETQ